MLKERKYKGYIVYIIPAFILIWGLYVNQLIGPFFLSRIDPEYPYLLNGLNAALLEFDNIGHTDHPGTPFQLLTGVFIRIIFFFSGDESLIESVISNPEMYLRWSSIFLTIIASLVTLWLGYIVYGNSKKIFGALIIQSSLFLNPTILGMFSRYNPDRILLIFTLIFVGLCLKYLYKDRFSAMKFAIYSGIIMAIGFITKVNFLPILIIPLVLLPGVKNRLIYIFTILVLGFILLLPIIDKWENIISFMKGVATHDGLYGKGSEQFVDISFFFQNLRILFLANFVFWLIFLCSVITFYFVFARKKMRKIYSIEFLILIGYFLATIIGVFTVAKHFKIYYFAPVLSLSGLIAYIIWRMLSQKESIINRKVFYFSIPALILIPFFVFFNRFSEGQENRRLSESGRLFVEKSINESSVLFIEPIWASGPFIENGLVYGNSYVNNNYEFQKYYENVYPNIITFKGKDYPLMYFNMIDIDSRSLLYSGKDIFIYSSADRNTSALIDFLNNKAAMANVNLHIDTVFKNTNADCFIRVNNTDNWRLLEDLRCGFEKEGKNMLMTDDESVILRGEYKLSGEQIYNGEQSLILNSYFKYSPQIILTNVVKGDFINTTVKYISSDTLMNWSLIISSENPSSDDLYFMNWEVARNISEGWKQARLSMIIPETPVDSTFKIFFQYMGDSTLYHDDFNVQHFSKAKKTMGN